MIVHATTVAVSGRGLMLAGASGSGKSGLALQLLALGADLVSDDRTVLSRPDGGPPLADAPEAISGLIEARGIGLLRTDTVGPVRVLGVLDLDTAETERLPAPRSTRLMEYDVRAFRRIDASWFPAALIIWLRQKSAE